MAMDARHRYMAQIVGDATGAAGGMVDAVVGDCIDLVDNFLTPAGPRSCYFMYQPELREGPGGELVPYGGKVLTISDKLKALVAADAKAVYFIRTTESKDGVSVKSPQQDMCSGEVNSQGLECFQSTLQVRAGSPRRSRASCRQFAPAQADNAVECAAAPAPRRARPAAPTAAAADAVLSALPGAVRAGARGDDPPHVGRGEEAGRRRSGLVHA